MSRSRSPVGWLVDRTPELTSRRVTGLRTLISCFSSVVVAVVLAGWLVAEGVPDQSGAYLAGVGILTVTTLAVISLTVARSLAAAGSQSVTAATVITMGRAGCLIALGGFLLTDPGSGFEAWIPGTLYAVAIALDGIDGQLARRRNAVTDLGRRLDTEIDAIAVLLGSVLVVVDGAAVGVFLLVGLARYAFVVGRWSRRVRGLPVFELPESRIRRPLAAGAMIVICLGLLPVPGTTVSMLVTTAVGVPFVLAFARDWLAVSGRR